MTVPQQAMGVVQKVTKRCHPGSEAKDLFLDFARDSSPDKSGSE